MLLFLTLLVLGTQDVSSSVKVEYIVMDVVARDKAGNPIKDLMMEDFEVRDGRKRVKPSHFEVLDFTASQTAASDLENEDLDPVQQTLILVTDLADCSEEVVDQVLGQIESFLAGRKDRQDVQMLVFSLNLGMISMGFTTSAQEIMDDLTVLESRLTNLRLSTPATHRASGFAGLEAEMGGCFSSVGTSSERFQTTDSSGMLSVRPCLENTLAVFVQRENERSARRLAVLEKFLVFLARVPGLKSVYLVSNGIAYQPGAAAAEMAKVFTNLKNDTAFSGSTPLGSGVTGSHGNTSTENQPFSAAHFQMPEVAITQSKSLDDGYKRLNHLSLSNRIVLHTFFVEEARQNQGVANISAPVSQGTRTERIYFRYARERQSGMEHLAEDSGGRFVNSNDLNIALEETLDRYRHYYVLAWPKPQAKNKKYRRVKVKSKRRDVKLQHRDGYFPIWE